MDTINDIELKEEISPNHSALALEIEAHIPENTSCIERQSNSTHIIANNNKKEGKDKKRKKIRNGSLCFLDQRELYILEMFFLGSLKVSLNPLFLLPFLFLSALGIYTLFLAESMSFSPPPSPSPSSFPRTTASSLTSARVVIIIFYLIGLITSLIFLSERLKWLIDFLTRPRYVDYREKYGQWVIITGSTSGSGKEYTEYFAEQGMNILMISRSEEKLIQQRESLNEKYNNNTNNNNKIEIRYIRYDLTEEAKLNGKERNIFYGKLQETIDEILNVRGETMGILVNNAGFNVDQPDYVEKVDDYQLSSIINCNVFATVGLTKFILPYLKNQRKGAIIFVSSGSTSHPTPLLALYSSSKAFINQFAISLAYELASFNIDVSLTLPYYMISNMYKKSKPSFLVCTAKRYVHDSISSLGRYYITSGYYVHGLLNTFLKYGEPTEDKRVTGNHILKLMLYNKKRIERRKQEIR